jgi:hypothetical protein
LDEQSAIKLAESKWWIGKDPVSVALAQLQEPILCMDFGSFQEAVGKACGRDVYTHEFINPEALIAEIRGRKLPPTLVEIIDKLPKGKSLILAI